MQTAPANIAKGMFVGIATAAAAVLFGAVAFAIYAFAVPASSGHHGPPPEEVHLSRDTFILILGPMAIGGVVYFCDGLPLLRPLLTSIAEFEIFSSHFGSAFLHAIRRQDYLALLYVAYLSGLALLAAAIGYYKAVRIDVIATVHARFRRVPKKGPVLALSLVIFVIAFFLAYGIGPEPSGRRQIRAFITAASVNFLIASWCVLVRATFHDPKSDW